MFLTRSDYDAGVNTFSPEGRIFQVEYAIEAIKLGSTAIGVRTDHGVVLAVEKRLGSSLMDPSSIKKIVEVDSHIGAAMSGLVADARTLIDHCRVECQNHWFSYNEHLRVMSCAQSVCDLALGFGEGKQRMSRPFGVALLLGGVDELGPQLYHTDPSGTFTRYKAKAIGAGSEGAQNALNEQYDASLSIPDTQKMALGVLKQVMEDDINPRNVEVAYISKEDSKYVVLDEPQLVDLIASLPEGLV